MLSKKRMNKSGRIRSAFNRPRGFNKIFWYLFNMTGIVKQFHRFFMKGTTTDQRVTIIIPKLSFNFRPKVNIWFMSVLKKIFKAKWHSWFGKFAFLTHLSNKNTTDLLHLKTEGVDIYWFILTLAILVPELYTV